MAGKGEVKSTSDSNQEIKNKKAREIAPLGGMVEHPKNSTVIKGVQTGLMIKVGKD